MTRLIHAGVALALLTACTNGYVGPTDSADMVPSAGQPLVIEYATGGSLYQSAQAFERMERDGTQVRIIGTCASACLLALRHKNVCYAPDAKFVLHGVSSGGAVDPRMSRAYEAALPPKLSAWSRAHEAMTDPDRLTTISGADMARLDDRKRICS